jgi:hypothetical protein
MAAIERIITTYRSGGLLSSFVATLNRPAAEKAEV